MRWMSGKIFKEKNKNQIKQKKTQRLCNAGSVLQSKYNVTSHRDTAEGLEGKKVQQKWS